MMSELDSLWSKKQILFWIFMCATKAYNNFWKQILQFQKRNLCKVYFGPFLGDPNSLWNNESYRHSLQQDTEMKNDQYSIVYSFERITSSIWGGLDSSLGHLILFSFQQ